jgi:hypothetical protein
MALEAYELAPATILRGHVSEDTAYLVDDYPYGRQLRTQIRYWLHTADRGAATGQVRLMSQTRNPKLPGEPWNKPKASTYYQWAVMILDARDYVRWWPISEFGPSPWGHLAMRLRAIYGQLADDERRGYDFHLAAAVAARKETWDKARRACALIAEGVTRDELLDHHGLYVDEREFEIAQAAHAAGVEF